MKLLLIVSIELIVEVAIMFAPRPLADVAVVIIEIAILMVTLDLVLHMISAGAVAAVEKILHYSVSCQMHIINSKAWFGFYRK